MAENKKEVIEKALLDLVKLPEECKNFMYGYMIGVQQERLSSEPKKSA